LVMTISALATSLAGKCSLAPTPRSRLGPEVMLNIAGSCRSRRYWSGRGLQVTAVCHGCYLSFPLICSACRGTSDVHHAACLPTVGDRTHGQHRKGRGPCCVGFIHSG
jgi:hypothetical protein